jgi:hypothetical protein
VAAGLVVRSAVLWGVVRGVCLDGDDGKGVWEKLTNLRLLSDIRRSLEFWESKTVGLVAHD